MSCQCLITNVVAAVVLTRTQAKKDPLKKGGVPDHASTMKANSKSLFFSEGEGGDLEDGPTNTHEPHGILIALNISVLSIQDNQSTVQCICRRLGVELRDRERSLSHPEEVCPAEARKARSQNQKSEEPMGGYSEESFPGDRKQDVGSTFFHFKFKIN